MKYTGGAMDRRYLLADWEVEARAGKLRAAISFGDWASVRYQQKWWKDFRQALKQMLYDMAEEYRMDWEAGQPPLVGFAENALVVHWEGQLEACEVMLYAIRGTVREHLNGKF